MAESRWPRADGREPPFSVRLETYVIEGERGSGTIQLNGAAARLGAPGDHVIVISYADFEDAEPEDFEPKIIVVDGKNRVAKKMILTSNE